MPRHGVEKLWEEVELATTAIRTASQLRRYSADGGCTDRAALAEAIAFLTQALEGGQFVTSSSKQLAPGATLRPLNWAADVYQARPQPSPPPHLDYAKFVEYVRSMVTCLEQVSRNEEIPAGGLDATKSFFEELGRLISSRIDNRFRRVSTPAQPF